MDLALSFLQLYGIGSWLEPRPFSARTISTGELLRTH
jgi:hypothetical protein